MILDSHFLICFAQEIVHNIMVTDRFILTEPTKLSKTDMCGLIILFVS